MRLAVAALLALLLAPYALHACTCLTVDPKSAFKRSEAVFLGEVIDYAGETARMRTIEWFKGPKTEVVELVTSYSNAECGYGASLTPGSRHLIYASRRGNRLEVWLCSRSRPESLADCDLRYVRSRAAWWRSPLSSLRLLSWLDRAPACERNSA